MGDGTLGPKLCGGHLHTGRGASTRSGLCAWGGGVRILLSSITSMGGGVAVHEQNAVSLGSDFRSPPPPSLSPVDYGSRPPVALR